jgi:hypothetical protein
MIVFDGNEIHIPESMGKPRSDQLQGTNAEKLSEIAGRICYDSLGSGRDSVGFHQHIKEVAHNNVYEHFHFTVGFNLAAFEHDTIKPWFFLGMCINRPGVWTELTEYSYNIEITLNLRSMLEWDRHTKNINDAGCCNDVKHALQSYAHRLAPQVIDPPASASIFDNITYLKTEGLSEDQQWLSMWMQGSRGWSHEQVRHRFSMSQRSTRYCDETESKYHHHPLLSQWLNDPQISSIDQRVAKSMVQDAEECDKAAYDYLTNVLEDYKKKQGLDKTSARKQARGAARGHLANALHTEMIFSAPLSGWRWMTQNRMNDAADAEIRVEFNRLWPYLEPYIESKTRPAKDGLGFVLDT